MKTTWSNPGPSPVRMGENMGAVHHSEGLEYAHLKPDADPNRLANLWGLLPEGHAIANKEAAAFRAALRENPDAG